MKPVTLTCVSLKQLRYLVQTTSRLSTGTNPEGHYVCSQIVYSLCQNRTSLKTQSIKLVRSKVLIKHMGQILKNRDLIQSMSQSTEMYLLRAYSMTNTAMS